MKSSRVKTIGFVLVVLLASTAFLAQDIPLRNWAVPPYHSDSGGLSPMTDISNAVAFVAVQPCRVVDTRGGGVFVGAYGPPIMAANATRDFDINSAPHCTGIPAGSQAYSLNFTVTQTAGASGDIRAWPTGTPPTVVTSVLNWQATNTTIANATIIPAGTAGSITVQVAGSNTHLLIDINGYFASTLNAFSYLEVRGNFAGGGVNFGENASSTNFSSGVRGRGLATTGAVFGVQGETNSTSAGTAGVMGISDGIAYTGSLNKDPAGVLGIGHGGGQGLTGVIDSSSGEGVGGYSLTSTGATGASGYLGYTNTTGVEAFGNISKTGTVSFSEPHATDASKKIVYVALEGNEAGTYFRGRGRFQNGLATINVPEDFRTVTQPEGMTVQVTPIGEMATVAVVSLGLEGIVVKSSRNVEFFYTVNGVRRGYGDYNPVTDMDKEYMPESPEATIPAWVTPEIRQRLISNGTYRPDGRVNLDTAQRLGWDRIWERNRPAPAPNPD